MRIVLIMAFGIFASSAALAQTEQSRTGTTATVTSSGYSTIERCSVHSDRADLSVSGSSTFSSAMSIPGVKISVTPTAGGLPTVVAHAINTKGVGAQDRLSAPQVCALAPSPRGSGRIVGNADLGPQSGALAEAPRGAIPSTSRRMSATATCAVSTGPEVISWQFAVPLSVFSTSDPSNNKTGHISLIKRGEVPLDGTIIARCDEASSSSSSKEKPMKGGWDLALATKG